LALVTGGKLFKKTSVNWVFFTQPAILTKTLFQNKKNIFRR